MPQDYDSAYKAFYERFFQKSNIPVETEVEVSRRARAIDVVIKCFMAHLLLLKDTCFRFFRRVNSLELKSPEDPLTAKNYMLIISRIYALLYKQEEAEDRLPSNSTLTIVCSVRPDKILDDMKEEFGFSPTEEPGVYLSKEPGIETRLIVATELDVIEKNYPLLILAKGEKLLEFFEEIVRKDLTEYIEIMFQVGVSIDLETLTKGVMKMAGRYSELPDSLKQTLNQWFEDYPQHIQEMSSIRRVLEEREIDAKQEDLSLLLESKFGSLSETLISQLSAVGDVDKLNRLYRQALDARTLDEVGIPEDDNA